MTGPRWGHAVVIGGAHAGLLAAHTLAKHFERVTVCERDLIDENTEFHPGVPQARHPHAVLTRGAELLEAKFPGLRAELAALGAPVYDAGLGLRYRLPSGRLPVSPLGVEIQNVSRTTLERAIRQRVLAHRRVELRAGFAVDGLELDRASGTVTGITGHQRDTCSSGPAGNRGPREHLPADFVVEATGRAAKLFGWLAEIGWERPEVLEVDGRMTYVSRFFLLPADHAVGWYPAGRLTYAPEINRGGGAVLVDGDRWICYHRLRRWPARLIAVGDAVCVFNPVYGQGLTVAAQEAQLLDELLSGTRTLTGLAQRFQRQLGGLLRLPWSMATSSDLLWDPAPPSRSARLIRWYLSHLLALMPTDSEVATRFCEYRT